MFIHLNLFSVQDIRLCISIILKWNKIYTSSNTTILYFINSTTAGNITKNYTILNGISWQRPIIHCIERHLSCYKNFGLMMACIGRNWSPLFKILKYKIVVFEEVCILLHFNPNLDSLQEHINGFYRSRHMGGLEV